MKVAVPDAGNTTKPLPLYPVALSGPGYTRVNPCQSDESPSQVCIKLQNDRVYLGE